MEHNKKRKLLIEFLIELIEEDYEKFHDNRWFEATVSEQAFYIITYIGSIISNVLDQHKVDHDKHIRSRSDLKRLIYELTVKNYEVKK